jgi:transposase
MLTRRRGKKRVVISPLALEAVQRIDRIFDIERAINRWSDAERLAVRQEWAVPAVAEFETWMFEKPAALSRHDDVGKGMDYMLKDWRAFAAFLDGGRICLTNNAGERALRGIALGRKSWLFVGSDRGGERAAFMYTLIGTCLCRARHKQVSIRVATTAQWSPPSSEPANRAFLWSRASGRIDLSTVLELISMRPSSRK